MIASFTYNYVFVHIARTGGTSLTGQLIDNASGFRLGDQHWTMQELTKNFYIYSNYASRDFFTIVRDPWDRVVSRYYGSAHFTKGRTLKEYIDVYLQKEDFMRPCCEYIKDSSGAVAIPNIYQFKKREAAEVSIAQLIGITPQTLVKPLVHQRGLNPEGQWRPSNYRSVYTTELKNTIASIYAEDISMFGYKF